LRLAVYGFDTAPQFYQADVMDTKALSAAAPGLGICGMTLFRIDGGQVSGSSVYFNSSQPGFTILSEAWSPDGYYLHISGSLSLNATVILGTDTIASRIERAPTAGGYFVYF